MLPRHRSRTSLVFPLLSSVFLPLSNVPVEPAGVYLKFCLSFCAAFVLLFLRNGRAFTDTHKASF